MLTRQMAEYLQQTVERITRSEHCHGDPKCYFTKDAHWFREGMVDRLVTRIRDRRREEEAERHRQKAEAEARGDGKSLMTIDDVAERERIANYDWQYGEGAWARRQADAAAERVKQRKAEAEFEAWKRDHPEEWAEQEAKRAEEYAKRIREEAKRARRRKVPVRRETQRDYDAYRKYSSSAYNTGRERGSDVSLDRQVDGGIKGGRLTSARAAQLKEDSQ
jgi:hypothetical protein